VCGLLILNTALWCNGNTGDFDSLVLGSNPGRATTNRHMLEEILQELKDTWDFDSEQLNHIKEKMKDFALACVMDKKVENELFASE
jgi:hypothetical protein